MDYQYNLEDAELKDRKANYQGVQIRKKSNLQQVLVIIYVYIVKM